MEVPEAREGSIEALLHQLHGTDHYSLFSEDPNGIYGKRNRQRAIGVVYNPFNEREGNYVTSLLSRRYDAFIYLDQTQALHPMQQTLQEEKIPETYPFGL